MLTGAGMSAPSGVSTFRGEGGLYEGRDPAELASPEGFARDPVTVWNWYAMRMRQVVAAKPHAGHFALVEMAARHELTLVTSNVDDLHDRAGSAPVHRLHGDILSVRCTETGHVQRATLDTWPEQFSADSLPRSASGALLRPNVVWFGEYPWRGAVEAMQGALLGCELFVEIGVSGAVSYGFTEAAVSLGVPVLRLNPEGQSAPGIEVWRESAEIAVPRLALELAMGRI